MELKEKSKEVLKWKKSSFQNTTHREIYLNQLIWKKETPMLLQKVQTGTL